MVGRNESFYKVLAAIRSCEIIQQLPSAKSLTINYNIIYEDLSSYELLLYEYNKKAKELEIAIS
jgi:hypothetical protein